VSSHPSQYERVKYPNATVTITINRTDAAYMGEDQWVDDRLERIADACRAALGETE
jgi:hypothetical protein